jgi:hypothetical protein
MATKPATSKIAQIRQTHTGERFDIYYDAENATYVIKKTDTRSANATGTAYSVQDALKHADRYVNTTPPQ